MLHDQIKNNIQRNKKASCLKYNNSNKQQALFVTLLCEAKREENEISCPVDNCSVLLDLEDDKGKKSHYCQCIVVNLIYAMMIDPMTSTTSKWMKLRKAVTTSDDLPPFVCDLLLELGYAFVIKKFPNFTENMWRRVVNDKNYKTTLDVPPVLDVFTQVLSKVLPLYSFNVKGTKLDGDIAVFYAACEPLLSDIKKQEILRLQDKYKCALLRAIMQTHLKSVNIGLSVLFLDEGNFLVKDKPDIYYTMSQAFNMLGAAKKQAEPLPETCSYGVHEVMPFFLEEDSHEGLNKALLYLYNLCIDIGDKPLHSTMDKTVNNSDRERSPLTIRQMQELFGSKYVVMCTQSSRLHLTDLLSGCTGNTQHTLDPDSEVEYALMLMRQHNTLGDSVTHLLLDEDLFVVLERDYVVNQQLGGAVFAMIVAGDKGLLAQGTRMPVYPLLARLALSSCVIAKKWLLSILHYWLFDDATAALELQARVTQEFVENFGAVVFGCISHFVTRNDVDLFMAANARVVAYKILLIVVNLMVACITADEASEAFIKTCLGAVAAKSTNLAAIEKALVSKPAKTWKYLKSTSAKVNIVRLVRGAITLPLKPRTTAAFPELAAQVADINTKAYADLVRFFATVDMLCVMDMPPTVALWHLQQTNTATDALKTQASPLFYCDIKEDYVYDEGLFLLPHSCTQRALATSTVHLSSVCIDKPVKDCRNVVLGSDKPIQPYQLYRDFESTLDSKKQ